jgi:CTP:molybdopterin cytidylyltransferase MocA
MEQMILKRFSLFVVLFVMLVIACTGLQAKTAQARVAMPFGSCGDTVSDDAQLFGNRIGDIVNQARTMNDSLQADTRVVTVNQDALAGRSLKDYFYYIVSKCPQWGEPQFVVLILTKGNEPFLHLGSTFSEKMTAADLQQMTLNIRSELTDGNYAQATIDLLKQIQKKLSPDYTWIWVTLAALVVLGAGGVLAVVFVRRRQAVAEATTVQQQAIHARQVAVKASSALSKQIEGLSPRIEVLLALTPQITATHLSALFETAKEKASVPQERLGNLLSNPDANPSSKILQVEHYAQMQRAYQEVYSQAQEAHSLLQVVETAVQRLERNPQEQIDFQQLTMQSLSQGHQRISRPDFSS